MKKMLFAITMLAMTACGSSDNTNQQDSSATSTVHPNEEADSTLEQIRTNAARIDAIGEWTRIDTIELEETTEGGVATYHYDNEALAKIVAEYYGEMFQRTVQYYLLNGQLSFVSSKTLHYNRPLYYDQQAMEENGDTVAFDIEKSTLAVRETYFDGGQILLLLENSEPLSNSSSTEEEQVTIMAFNKLIELSKNEQPIN